MEERQAKERKIAEESVGAYKEGLQLIYNFFHEEADQIYENQSGNDLYYAVSVICRKLQMEIVSWNNLIKAAGEDFTIADIARMSHFPIRKLILEPDWYKKDCGYLLMWMIQEDGKEQPTACIPARWGGYRYQDPNTGVWKKVDAQTAEKFHPQAYMIYKPFLNEAITAGALMKYAANYLSVKDWTVYVLMCAAGMLISLLLPFLTQLIYDRYLGFGEAEPIVQLCLVILACNMAGLCFGVVRNLAAFRSITSAKYAVQAAAYDRLFNLPDRVFRQYEAADLGNRISGVGQIFDEILNQLSAAIMAAICSLAYLVVTIKHAPAMTLYGIGILLVGVGCIWPCIWLQKKYVRKQLDAESRMTAASYQFIDGVGKLKLAGAENKASAEFLKTYVHAKKYYTKSQKMAQMRMLLKLVITTILSAAFYYLAVSKVIGLTIGAFLGFVSAFGCFSSAVLELMDAFATTGSITALFERAQPILQQEAEYESQEQILDSLTGRIELDHVTFSYREDEEAVLKDVTIQIEPGEYLGIVGSSGCGKSTLMKLLLGFEKTDPGRIYFDGHDIAKLNKRELRKQMGVVLQDGKVFGGSIYDNITLTAPGADQESVWNVIKAVDLEMDIARMPMGIHTYLSEGGSTISGGQQQKILIARAILGNPKIILLDEATSALDNVTQQIVCENMEKLNATRIVIAHRLSTIRNCDRILVMEAGRIVESGTYEELMAKQGAFFELASRQEA